MDYLLRSMKLALANEQKNEFVKHEFITNKLTNYSCTLHGDDVTVCLLSRRVKNENDMLARIS